MEDKIIFPSKYIRWKRKGQIFYFDLLNWSYISINSDGEKILSLIRQGYTIDQIVQRLRNYYLVSPDIIKQKVNRFVTQLIREGFLHFKTYRPKIETISFIPPDHPHVIYLHVTYRCNLQCTYCYNADYRVNFSGQELRTQDFLEAIDQIGDIGAREIIFTGGEPLLRPDIFRIANYARRKGFKVQLFTNGTLITRENAKRISETFHRVMVTLDGHVPEVHEKHRGVGTFNKVTKAIKSLTDLNVDLVVSTVITKYNIDSYIDICEYALNNLGANTVLMVPCELWKSWDEYQKLMPSLDKFFKLRRLVAQKYRVPEIPLIPRNQCGAGTGEIAIGPDGSVYPCQNLLMGEFICGNIRETNLTKIYTNSSILRMFKELTVEDIEVCNKCDLKYLCAGGCRATAYKLYNDIKAYNGCHSLE